MGAAFGRYEIEALLGRGGMAEVFRARLRGLGGFEKQVALKRVLPSRLAEPGFVTMLLDEARLTARLSHPNLVQVFEVGAEDGIPFIAMEYVCGPTMRQLLQAARAQGGLIGEPSRSHLVWVLSQVCRGLDHAHRAVGEDGRPLGIVHRDVCPRNIMITSEGTPKVLDFGIARAQGRATDSDVGTIKGKVAYMAPEQISGAEVGPFTDVYAVGACLYEVLTGRQPVRASTPLAVLKELLEEPPPDPRALAPDCPDALATLVRSALTRNPRERCPNARAFGAGLESYLRSQGYRFSTDDVVRWIHSLVPDERFGETEALPMDLSIADAQTPSQGAGPLPRTETADRASAANGARHGPWLALAAALTLGAVAAGTWWLTADSNGPPQEPSSHGGVVATVPPPSPQEDTGARPESTQTASVAVAPPRITHEEAQRDAQVEPLEPPATPAISTEEPRPATGVLTVDCVPQCQVWVDGRRRGEAPVTVSGLSVGTHAVRVAADGFREQRLSASVQEGATTTLPVRLARVTDERPTPPSSAARASPKTPTRRPARKRGRAPTTAQRAPAPSRALGETYKRASPIPSSNLPARVTLRTPDAVTKLLARVEAQSMSRGNVPRSVARGVTGIVRSHALGKLAKDGVVVLRARKLYKAIVRGAREGLPRSAIARQLKRL